ncbi:hypothetical protein, partial [Enterobacter hormaechei]|uniref:hypothetical protein n=1 Tax=Enterobacter hormaechei TaxID=158836 RepID=UPI001953537C
AEIFGSSKEGFTWGSREKMYRISGGEIQVVDYVPRHDASRSKSAGPKVLKAEPEFLSINLEKTNISAGDV